MRPSTTFESPCPLLEIAASLDGASKGSCWSLHYLVNRVKICGCFWVQLLFTPENNHSHRRCVKREIADPPFSALSTFKTLVCASDGHITDSVGFMSVGLDELSKKRQRTSWPVSGCLFPVVASPTATPRGDRSSFPATSAKQHIAHVVKPGCSAVQTKRIAFGPSFFWMICVHYAELWARF